MIATNKDNIHRHVASAKNLSIGKIDFGSVNNCRNNKHHQTTGIKAVNTLVENLGKCLEVKLRHHQSHLTFLDNDIFVEKNVQN